MISHQIFGRYVCIKQHKLISEARCIKTPCVSLIRKLFIRSISILKYSIVLEWILFLLYLRINGFFFVQWNPEYSRIMCKSNSFLTCLFQSNKKLIPAVFGIGRFYCCYKMIYVHCNIMYEVLSCSIQAK